MMNMGTPVEEDEPNLKIIFRFHVKVQGSFYLYLEFRLCQLAQKKTLVFSVCGIPSCGLDVESSHVVCDFETLDDLKGHFFQWIEVNTSVIRSIGSTYSMFLPFSSWLRLFPRVHLECRKKIRCKSR